MATAHVLFGLAKFKRLETVVISQFGVTDERNHKKELITGFLSGIRAPVASWNVSDFFLLLYLYVEHF